MEEERGGEHYAHLVMETQKEVSSLGGQIGETRAGGGDNASFTPTVHCTTKSVMHSWGGIGRASYSLKEHKVSWSC